MRRIVIVALAAALAAGVPSMAQVLSTVQLPSGYAPGQAMCFGSIGSPVQCVSRATPLPTLALPVQEAITLAAANVAATPATAFGGSYIFSQSCTAYGSTSLQVLGADGVTWQTVTTASAADTTGGTALALGSGARVRVALTGTSGCAATISRVPA